MIKLQSSMSKHIPVSTSPSVAAILSLILPLACVEAVKKRKGGKNHYRYLPPNTQAGLLHVLGRNHGLLGSEG